MQEGIEMPDSLHMTSRIAAPLALSALLLGGCASFSADGGMNDVTALTQERTGQPVRRTTSDKDRA
ncbi:MAG: hypothetical protein ACTHKB_14325, partial [Burkholderiaceae bacterium]